MQTKLPIAATSSMLSSSLGHAPISQAGSRWRVLIVDSHSSIREMIRVILDGYADLIEVVGEASDRDEAVELAKTMAIDLVLMDTHLPDAIDATRQLKKMVPQVVNRNVGGVHAVSLQCDDRSRCRRVHPHGGCGRSPIPKHRLRLVHIQPDA